MALRLHGATVMSSGSPSPSRLPGRAGPRGRRHQAGTARARVPVTGTVAPPGRDSACRSASLAVTDWHGGHSEGQIVQPVTVTSTVTVTDPSPKA
jgi:hypothetical protein